MPITRKIILALSAFILLCGAFFACVFVSASTRNSHLAAQSNVEPASTSNALTCDQIFQTYHSYSTELQRVRYTESLTGTPISCAGKVTNVTSDGLVYLTQSHALVSLATSDYIILHDLPPAELFRLSVDSPLRVVGTVRESTSGVGLSLHISVSNQQP